MRYQVWPMAQIDGEWSVPDIVLRGLWRQLVDAGKMRPLFYTGKIFAEDQWVGWLKSPGNYPLIIVDAANKKIVAVTWLNGATDGAAQVHFGMFGLPRPGIGRAALEYWRRLGILSVIVGITPEHYTAAIKYALSIGFTKVGVIPGLCDMVYEGRRVGGVLTYYEFEKEV